MKTNFKKMALLTLALLTLGGVSMKAATYEKTYDFTGSATAYTSAGGSVTVPGLVDGNENLVAQQVLADANRTFDSKFAFGYRFSSKVQSIGADGFKFDATEGFKITWEGRAFVILDLNAGDKITLSFTGTIKTTDTSLTGVAEGTALTSGTEYTMLAAGNLILNPSVNPTAISSIKIVTPTPNCTGDNYSFSVQGFDPAGGEKKYAGALEIGFGADGGDWVYWGLTGDANNPAWKANFPYGVRIADYPKDSNSSGVKVANKKIPVSGPFLKLKAQYDGTVTVYGKFKGYVFLMNEDCSYWWTSDNLTEDWQTVSFRVKAGVQYWLCNDYNSGYYNGATYSPDYFDISVSPAGYATFGNYSASNLQAPEGVTVYAATYNSGTDKVTLTEVSNRIIPAGQGVIISAAKGSYAFSTTVTDWDYAGTNDLVPASATETLAQTADGKTNYILAADGEEAKFYAVDGSSSIAAGKAYLSIARDYNSSARSLDIVFSDATAISNMVTAQPADGRYYNLQGMEVKQPQKGLYIVNGKKVIMK